MMGVCEIAHTPDQVCDGFDMGIIDSYVAEHCKNICPESVWWVQARQRFTTQQVVTKEHQGLDCNCLDHISEGTLGSITWQFWT